MSFDNQQTGSLRATRLAEISERVRDESMRVNAEFAAFEHEPDIIPPDETQTVSSRN